MKNKGLSTHRFKQNPLEMKFALEWETINANRNGTLDYMFKQSGTGYPNIYQDNLVLAEMVQKLWKKYRRQQNKIKWLLFNLSRK